MLPLNHFEGPAKVFDSQEAAACEGILGGKVVAGDVVVITHEGPKGGRACKKCSTPLPTSKADTWEKPAH